MESINAFFDELEIEFPIRIFFREGDFNRPPDSLYRDCKIVSKHPIGIPLSEEVIEKLILRKRKQHQVGRSLKVSKHHRIFCSYRGIDGSEDLYLIVPISLRLPRIEILYDQLIKNKLRDLV